MENANISPSKWDGQLPPHIAKIEQIWWGVFHGIFQSVRLNLPPKLFGLIGRATEPPSCETIGKVIYVVDIKALGKVLASLLNDWGCYCQQRRDGLDMVYMAGTKTEPMLTFRTSSPSILSLASPRFDARIDPTGADAIQGFEHILMDTFKQMSSTADLGVNDVLVVTYKRGSWENGLDIAFKAAIWFKSNPEEALTKIWKTTIK